MDTVESKQTTTVEPPLETTASPTAGQNPARTPEPTNELIAEPWAALAPAATSAYGMQHWPQLQTPAPSPTSSATPSPTTTDGPLVDGDGDLVLDSGVATTTTDPAKAASPIADSLAAAAKDDLVMDGDDLFSANSGQESTISTTQVPATSTTVASNVNASTSLVKPAIELDASARGFVKPLLSNGSAATSPGAEPTAEVPLLEPADKDEHLPETGKTTSIGAGVDLRKLDVSDTDRRAGVVDEVELYVPRQQITFTRKMAEFTADSKRKLKDIKEFLLQTAKELTRPHPGSRLLACPHASTTSCKDWRASPKCQTWARRDPNDWTRTLPTRRAVTLGKWIMDAVPQVEVGPVHGHFNYELHGANGELIVGSRIGSVILKVVVGVNNSIESLCHKNDVAKYMGAAFSELGSVHLNKVSESEP